MFDFKYGLKLSLKTVTTFSTNRCHNNTAEWFYINWLQQQVPVTNFEANVLYLNSECAQYNVVKRFEFWVPELFSSVNESITTVVDIDFETWKVGPKYIKANTLEQFSKIAL